MKALRATTHPIGGVMVWVPPGEFRMGSLADEPGNADERPAHPVRLPRGFWLGRTLVTNLQYQQFIRNTGRTAWEYFDHPDFGIDPQPVVGVTWDNAMAFCRWAGGRLPTEAEWEYAARGPESRRYPWGNDAATPDRADYGQPWKTGHPLPVDSKPLGAAWCGALDLAGSVWEWCSDWYAADYYLYAPEADPIGPETGEDRVVRGGCWGDTAEFLRAAVREYHHPESSGYYQGFRLLLDDDA